MCSDTIAGNSVVLVPYTGRIEPACEYGLRCLEALGVQVRRVSGYANLDIARNEMATAAMDEFEWIMWIDADIGFEAESVVRLISHNKDIVCAIYAKKGQQALACALQDDTTEVLFGKGGGLIEIKYAATGFLLTHRRVYERIRDFHGLPLCNRQFGRPTFPFFMSMVINDGVDPWYLGDDFAFCHRAREAGFSIWADTAIRLLHYGGYGYGWEDAASRLDRYSSFQFRVVGPEQDLNV